MIPEVFAPIGALINLIGSLTYAYNTLRGRTRPNRVTWLLWSLAPSVAFVTEISDGKSLLIALATLSTAVGPLIVLLASFTNKQAYWRISKFDILCGLASVVAFTFFMSWKLTGAGASLIALSLAILADALAGLPAMVKSYKYPETEHYSAYLLGTIGMGLTLLTISDWTFMNYAFPGFIFLDDIVFLVLVVGKVGPRIHKRNYRLPKET